MVEESFWDNFSDEWRDRNKNIVKRYEDYDQLIKRIVIPEFKRCIDKEGECAK